MCKTKSFLLLSQRDHEQIIICIPLINTATTGPIAVYHFSLINETTAVIAVAITSSIEMMDNARTASSHAIIR